MKKSILRILLVMFIINIFLCTILVAQDNGVTANDNETAIAETVSPIVTNVDEMSNLETFARRLVGSYLVKLFVEGGWVLWPMLILTIWGFAMCIWKIVALSYAKVNLNNFLNQIMPLIKAKKYKEAAELAYKTRGPVASVTHSALIKADKSIEAVEKAIENAATIEMAFLEKGFININTTINLAPMFGFFGTILGMIEAFDSIARAGEVDPTIVADGIKVALITTMAGLAIAIPVQFINNVLLQMVDGLVLDMQRASDKIIETVVENQ